MKLFYAVNACSMAIHVLLEEIGKPYEGVAMDFAGREQYGADFVAKNPKSKVPTLERDDGSILTELPAIAYYLARANPEKNLLPPGLDGEVRSLELLDYTTATIHMRGYTRMIRPNTFAVTPEDEPKIVEIGRGFVTKGFEILAPALGDKPFLFGDNFTIADAGLFFLEYWAAHRCNVALPPVLSDHLTRMMDRPAVQRALDAEGLT
jgi:glutathione S-transferase